MKKLVVPIMALVLLGRVFAQSGTGLATVESVPGILEGSRLVLVVTGNSRSGKVWGTDIYTADSSIAAAAVHAGAIGEGQTGQVVIEVLQGAPSYTGSSRNGVASQFWPSYPLSFRFVAAFGQVASPFPQSPGGMTGMQPFTPAPAPAPAVLYAFEDPALLRQMKAGAGTVFHFMVTGARTGSLWGSGPYTLDSSLAAAAVHAGALTAGQQGVVKVTIVPGQSSFQGGMRNGVSSGSWGAYPTGYLVEPVADKRTVVPVKPDPGTVERIASAASGQTHTFWVTGTSRGGSVWGTDMYTSDSTIAAAAVHAGVLAEGESGAVIVRVQPGQTSYRGTSRNGVTSSSYGSYGLGFTLERAR